MDEAEPELVECLGWSRLAFTPSVLLASSAAGSPMRQTLSCVGTSGGTNSSLCCSHCLAAGSRFDVKQSDCGRVVTEPFPMSSRCGSSSANPGIPRVQLGWGFIYCHSVRWICCAVHMLWSSVSMNVNQMRRRENGLP